VYAAVAPMLVGWLRRSGVFEAQERHEDLPVSGVGTATTA
jgi:hypothetical protein